MRWFKKKTKTIMWRFGVEDNVIKLAKEMFDCINEIKKCDHNKEFRKDIQIDGYPIRQLIYSVHDDIDCGADIQTKDLEYPVVRFTPQTKKETSTCIHEAKHYQQGVDHYIDGAEYVLYRASNKSHEKKAMMWYIAPNEIDAVIAVVIHEYVKHKTFDELEYRLHMYNVHLCSLDSSKPPVKLVSCDRTRTITVDELRYELTRGRDLLIKLRSTIEDTGVRIGRRGYYVDLSIDIDMVYPNEHTGVSSAVFGMYNPDITFSMVQEGIRIAKDRNNNIGSRSMCDYVSWCWQMSSSTKYTNEAAFKASLELQIKDAMLHNTFNYTQS